MSMTFDEQEASREDGKPVLLFHIRYGPAAANFYAYTDGEEAIVYGGVTYKPETITHSGIRQSGTLDNSQSSFTTPHNNDLALRFRSWPPSEVISLVVRQGHVDNDEFPVIWSGRILSSKLNEKDEAVYALERINTSMMRSGLRRKYGEVCPHLLYSQGEGACNADREAATSVVTVTAVNGPLVTLGGAWPAKANKDKYINGISAWQTADARREVRSIIKILGADQVLLGGPALDLAPGMDMEVTYGCDHLLDGDCEALHNNAQNYGGQWLIPLDNPIGIKNPYY